MKKVISLFLSLLLMLTLSGCRFNFKPTYWNGMTKQETEELILSKLEEKYSEEFEILDMYPTFSSGFLRSACSPKADNELVFETELWLSENFYDTYIQSIVRREMKEVIDSVLFDNYESFAAEVYVRGLERTYDSGIHSAGEVSIKSFTEALPDKNLGVVWIAFDKEEFVEDYGAVEPIINEIFESFGSMRSTIDCYFVDSDTLRQCQEKILNHHSEYGYRILTDMEVMLSSKLPVYCFVYNGVDLWLDHYIDETGINFQVDIETNEELN